MDYDGKAGAKDHHLKSSMPRFEVPSLNDSRACAQRVPFFGQIRTKCTRMQRTGPCSVESRLWTNSECTSSHLRMLMRSQKLSATGAFLSPPPFSQNPALTPPDHSNLPHTPVSGPAYGSWLICCLDHNSDPLLTLEHYRPSHLMTAP